MASSTTTTTKIPATTTGTEYITNNWLGTMPGVPTALREREDWLNSKFNEYATTQAGANNAYGGVLDALMSRLNGGGDKISFGLEGNAPVSFMPQTALNEMSAIQSLADTQRTNTMRLPTEQWAWQQTNPLHTADMQIFDLLKSLNTEAENRRYGLPTTTTTANYSQGNPSLFTVLGGLANLANTGMDTYDKGKSLGWWGS